MSRSTKKPIVKDKKPKAYWRRIRSAWNNWIRSGKDPNDLPNHRTIVNDYDVCDWSFNYENGKPLKNEYLERAKRK